MAYLLVAALPIILTVLLIIHVIRTGRNTLWIWLIIFLPLAGAIAYALVELLPELLNSRTAQTTRRNVRRALDPQAQLRRLQDEAQVTQNVASNQRFAEELLRHDRFQEAAAVYRKVLTGLYAHDPDLMLGLARAQFGGGDASAARATLDEALHMNPNYRSPQAHLLYARALETEGDMDKALAEYQVLSTSYPGAEAAVRYAQLLKAQGRVEESRAVAKDLLEQARIAPAHYRRAQRDWLDNAQRLALGR
ncbi:MAG TPA: tetratricopeptide repeat protein [Steroidobacteraceae bacterium]|nr:tetratricopeptide repeat protein [Steroidobacteraceae bacterium]